MPLFLVPYVDHIGHAVIFEPLLEGVRSVYGLVNVFDHHEMGDMWGLLLHQFIKHELPNLISGVLAQDAAANGAADADADTDARRCCDD